MAEIYNQGIAERSATFETDAAHAPRTCARRIEEDPERFPVLVAEEAGAVVGWASIGPYRDRPATRASASSPSTSIATPAAAAWGAPSWRGSSRRRGAAATGSSCPGSSPPTPASLALCRSLGFREVGTYEKHGRLDGRWLDVVIVERLIPENQP